jgi:Spy/CpxP family protein refolding chaperone
MKKIITSALVLALAFGSAQAQKTSGHKGKGYNKENRMGGYDKLNLTADQKSRLDALKATYKQQAADLKNNTQLSDEQRKTRKKELHQNFKSQADAILTPEQKEQLSQMKANRTAKGKNANFKGAKGNKMAMGARGEGLQKELNLSQDQQAKMTQIRTETRTKMQALRNDNSLSQDQKRTKMQELMKAQQEQVKTILTKEQVEKMESVRKERSARFTR